MSAQVVNLADWRSRRPLRPAVPPEAVVESVAVVPGATPYVLTAHQGAVSLVADEFELWFEPGEALELGEELIRLAHEAAEREGERG